VSLYNYLNRPIITSCFYFVTKQYRSPIILTEEFKLFSRSTSCGMWTIQSWTPWLGNFCVYWLRVLALKAGRPLIMTHRVWSLLYP